MAYNYPPPDGGAGLGGLFPGLGGGLGGDAGFFGGGFPGWAGPYTPITPLGSLWGFKGDLIVPIVAIGVALFILLLIVLAVKYALAWKLDVLGDIAGSKKGKFRRDFGSAPAPHLEDASLTSLADVVSAAIYSEGCSRRILCEIGTFARESKQYNSLIRLIELIVPQDYQESLLLVQRAADSNIDCAAEYPCGAGGNETQGASSNSPNDIDVTKGKTAGQKVTFGAPSTSSSSSKNNATTTPGEGGGANSTNPAAAAAGVRPDTTPAPTVFGKFQRAIFNR